MEQAHKLQITAAINKWIKPDNNERTAAKLSQRSGVSTAIISNIKQGKYVIGSSPISDSHFYKLADFLQISFRDGEPDKHFETFNFNMIQKVCKSAQAKKKIVLLDSDDSGVGKTYTLEHYNTFHDKVLYIKCTSSMGAKDLLNEILEKLQIKTKLVGNKAKLNAIRERLISSPGYLIIIDEVEDVKIGIYKVIKEIIDFTYNRIAMIVSGMRLKDKIELLANKGRVGFPQLKRRLFTNIARVQPVQHTEIVKIIAEHGITNKGAQSWFVNNVRDFQMLSEYLKDALEISKQQKQTIDMDFLADLFNTF